MKNKMLTLVAILLCLGFSSQKVNASPVSAQNNERVEKELKEYIDAEKDSKKRSISEDSFTISDYDLTKTYSVHLLDTMMITSYNKSKEFKSLITDNVRTVVPCVVNGKEEGVIVLKNHEDNVEVVGQIVGDTPEYKVLSEEEIKEKVKKELNQAINTITYTYSDLYMASLVYVETECGQYIIPFAKEGRLGVENGKIYSVDSLFKSLNKVFDEQQFFKDAKSNAGLPYRAEGTDKNSTYLVCIFCLLSICIATSSLIYVRKMRRETI